MGQQVTAIGDGKSFLIVDASQMRATENSAKRFEEYVSLMASANRQRGVLPSVVKRMASELAASRYGRSSAKCARSACVKAVGLSKAG
jgi:hypothetical protein